MEIEIHRTRKGRVVLDEPTQIYHVWLFRSDGMHEQVLETRHHDVAIAFLKDYRIDR